MHRKIRFETVRSVYWLFELAWAPWGSDRTVTLWTRNEEECDKRGTQLTFSIDPPGTSEGNVYWLRLTAVSGVAWRGRSGRGEERLSGRG